MKQIRSRTDLAIHGAPPAFSTPLHVGRPNIGSRDRFLALVGEMFERGWLTNNGPLVNSLEARIAERLQVAHCVAMCNGTVALEIAIRALGLHGEVIVPSYTFIATAHALHWQAIDPVFADIDPSTHNLDPDSVRALIGSRTTGIIGVHLWGRPAPHAALAEIADAHGLALLFDAAHAFGATSVGRPIGSFGRCEVLSFHATKVFNTFEGGAVVTNDSDLAARMRLMRNFGFSGFDNVIHPGTNGKMPEVCAAMGLVNLDDLGRMIDHNRRNHVLYASALGDLPELRLLAYDPTESANYQYVVLEVDAACPISRDRLVAILHAEGVLARRYFWPGCHRMKPYRDLFPRARLGLPVTEAVAERVIVLPTGLPVQEEEIRSIAAVLRVALRG